MYEYPLGRRIPSDFEHVAKYPFRGLASAAAPVQVERVLKLPSWHWEHDQGAEGSCVGHGTAMERAITNTAQNVLLRVLGIKARRYDPIDIWNEAKLVDGFSDTNPGDDNGTTVRAGYDVMRDRGPRRVKTMKLVGDAPTPIGEQPPSLPDGAVVNRWATTVDEVRAAIGTGVPVTLGVNWYSSFDSPEQVGREMWIGRNPETVGIVRGGHCLVAYGASDKRQAVRLKNSWGRFYPLVWLGYGTLERLLKEDGEAAVITDR